MLACLENLSLFARVRTWVSTLKEQYTQLFLRSLSNYCVVGKPFISALKAIFWEGFSKKNKIGRIIFGSLSVPNKRCQLASCFYFYLEHQAREKNMFGSLTASKQGHITKLYGTLLHNLLVSLFIWEYVLMQQFNSISQLIAHFVISFKIKDRLLKFNIKHTPKIIARSATSILKTNLSMEEYFDSVAMLYFD